jgi:SAM-dependent methyltransferase
MHAAGLFCESAASHNPHWCDGYFYAAMCHLIDQNYADAAFFHQKALKQRPYSHYSHYLYAGIALWVIGLKGKANIHWWHAHRMERNPMTDAFLNRYLSPDAHPEMLALFPLCLGRGIDVGCGSRKTHPDAIGIDITARGEMGTIGCEAHMLSCADVTASGDNLHMFADDSLDYVVQRHNLEHYQDPVKALQEWCRVLRPGGLLGMVIPDDEVCDTIHLDTSHKHVFTQSSLRRIIDLLGTLAIVHIGPLLKSWSFICVLQKPHCDMRPDFDYLACIRSYEAEQVSSEAVRYSDNGHPHLAEQCRRYLAMTNLREMVGKCESECRDKRRQWHDYQSPPQPLTAFF